ncbi:MAG: SpoIIE family protein phosphatase [Cytophagales bacterium]|nr:SpoIIE family protein phosphatase [Cytophagales bacterium]
MNIRIKLILLSAFLVITSSGVLFIFTDTQVENTLRKEMLSNISQQSEQSVENIERFIFSRLNDVQLAAKNPYFRNSEISTDELIIRLQELEELNDLYYTFSYFDMNRIRIADSKRQSIGKEHSNSSYWLELDQKEAVMDITISESSGQVVMHFASLVRGYSDNQPIAILVGTIRVDELYKLMGDFSLSTDVNRRLNVNWVDDDGTLLYSNTNQVDLKSTFSDFDLIKDLNDPGVNLLETKDELIFVTQDTGYLSYQGNDWKLVLSIDKDQAFLPLRKLQTKLLFVIIGSLIASLFLAVIIANIFVRPLVELSNAAEEIGKGNLKVNIAVTSKGEIGKLAHALQKTTQILIKRIGEQRLLNKRLHEQKAQLENQKGDIESVHEEVRDSINYSKRIQNSILPDSKELKRVFEDKLLLFRPKDVVSGDFYWFERVRTGRKEHMIVVAADCTGHGVPGAIMSMIGSNQLTNIIYYQNYIDPEKILARLDKAIKFELYQDVDADEPRHDGMEAGICSIDLDTMELTFAGAGLAMYFIRNGEMEMHRSPKVTIGRMEGSGKAAEDQFTPLRIQLETGDRIYLASDGFQDQFGGPSDKRFMSKNFRNLLLISGQDRTMVEQEAKLIQTFDHWKGNGEQTDDVLVLGFEI